MTGDMIKGVVTTDPLEAVPVGFALPLEALAFPALKLSEPPYDTLTSFKGVVAMLLVGTVEQSQCWGSAVMVAPGVAVAAKHVFDAQYDDIMSSKKGFLCVALAPWGLDVWRVHQVLIIDATDVVMLMLERQSELPPEGKMHHAFVSTRLPPVGEPVAMVGFIAGAASFDGAMHGNIHVAQGLVTAHHLVGRDRVLMPGPCIEVAVGAPGGMSGGPVFDVAGAVIGVTSTSFGSGVDDISYVSLTLPALVRKMQPCWPKGLHQAETTLLEFGGKISSIERANAMKLSTSPEDKFGYSYEPWS